MSRDRCAAGPWRPMEDGHPEGKVVLLLGEGGTLALGVWDEEPGAWYLDDSSFAPRNAFVAWAEVFLPEEVSDDQVHSRTAD